MENKNEDIEIDLVDLFYLIKARLWVIILSGVICAAIAGSISSFLITPQYTSKTQLYILNKTASISSIMDSLQASSQLTQDYMVMVKSRTVVNKVIEDLDVDMKYEQMAGIISVSNPSQTRILEISCTYPNAEMAKKIVDEFANVSKKRIAELTDSKEPTIIDWGYASPTPSGPNTTKNTLIGAFIGLFIAAGVIIVLHLMDDTIKDSDDIEKYLGLSTLGLIPLEAGSGKQAQLDKKKRKKQKTVSKNRKGQ